MNRNGSEIMKNTWKIQIWGVRGSFPAPAEEFLLYGGNTVCVSVSCDANLIVFDAGSGLAALGNALENALEKGENYPRIDIFLSHLHLDHLMGFFTFRPFYRPDMEIHIYGQDHELDRHLCRLLAPPYWPIGLKDFQAKVFIHPLCPKKTVRLFGQEHRKEGEGIILHTLPGNHPGKSLLYRMEGAGKSLVYGLDCEIDAGFAPAYIDFARNADLLFWDAAFTEKDKKAGWGHSTWEQGIAFRQQANINQVLMLHYSSDYTDSFLARQEELAKQRDPASCFAKEGMTILLP